MLPVLLSASDFVAQFMERYAENNRPLNNVNIGKDMLEKMAEETTDSELQAAFNKLNSICIISSNNRRDSRYYFRKAGKLVKESYSDYREVVSINEQDSHVSVWLKEESATDQHLILVSLDEENKFTVITLTGEIDFNSIARLSKSLKDKPELLEQTE